MFSGLPQTYPMVKHHDQKQLGRGKIYSSLQLSGLSASSREVSKGAQGKNLELGAEADTVEDVA